MIGAVGDVVEDIAVRLLGPIQTAADTDATIVRRRGGSAANLAVSVARAGHAARFIGQIGSDSVGDAMLTALRDDGVDVTGHRGGRSGSIVVLLDHAGERTMLTDRGCCADLDHPDPEWLDGLTTLHVPVYSLVGEPLARTATTLALWSHDRGITVSVDASSSSVIDAFGVDALVDVLRRVRPFVLFCNEAEAELLGRWVDPGSIGATVTVVKHGALPAEILQHGLAPLRVPALSVANVLDTTGAGDAFAAGFLVALANGSSPVAATTFGHQSAARTIAAVSAAASG